MPIEYCEYSGRFDKCRQWLERNLPEMVGDLSVSAKSPGCSDEAAPAEAGRATGGEEEEGKKGHRVGGFLEIYYAFHPSQLTITPHSEARWEGPAEGRQVRQRSRDRQTAGQGDPHHRPAGPTREEQVGHRHPGHGRQRHRPEGGLEVLRLPLRLRQLSDGGGRDRHPGGRQG